MSESSIETRSVNLAADLCAKAEERFGSQFDGVEDLLEYVLRNLLRDDAARADESEQRLIEQRLKDLGYL